ncbi:MAG: hypothetical protein RL240_949, partial [Planctomycetota bacterium]
PLARDIVPGYAVWAIRSHPLPSGGSREENLHRLATSGYGALSDQNLQR